MNFIYSLAIALALALSFHPFIKHLDKKRILFALLIEIAILSILSFTTLKYLMLKEFEQTLYIYHVLGASCLYIVYFAYIRPLVYIQTIKKEKLKTVELLLKERGCKGQVFICDLSQTIKVIGGKVALVSEDITKVLSVDEIKYVVMAMMHPNGFWRYAKYSLVLVPVTLFYYAFAYNVGTLRQILLIIAGAMIYPLLKMVNNSKSNNEIYLKNQEEKSAAVAAIKKYYIVRNKKTSKIRIAKEAIEEKELLDAIS